MRSMIITGSEGLIGKEVVRYFSTTYNVIPIDKLNGNDLSDEDYVNCLFSENKADCLINLFALNDHIDNNRKTNKIMDISLDSFRDYLETNVVDLFSVCRAFAKNNTSGCIVNFSSTYGLVSPRTDLYSGDEKHIAYGTSKAAVIQLSRHLAVHLAPNIRVNVVVPGGVLNAQSPSFVEKYSSNTPMKRMMSKDELNGIIEYLCSEKSTYVTGSVFVVDGGWTII